MEVIIWTLKKINKGLLKAVENCRERMFKHLIGQASFQAI